MKVVKKILIGIASLIVLLLIIALFVDRKYEIKREIVVNRPKAEVFDYVKHIKNQDNYSVWNMADPNKEQKFTGEDGTVGFKNYWNGNDDVGEGEQEIVAIKEGERVDIAITFKRPLENKMDSYIATEDAGTGTKVSWTIYGESSYPMNLMNLMMNSMLGKDLQGSLNNLKNNLEKK